MTTREELHTRISELLEMLNINNNRLSLHEEQLSKLDIDVLRKQCIDLYEQINLLSTSSVTQASKVEAAIEAKIEKVEEAQQVEEEAPKVKEVPIQKLEKKAEEVKPVLLEKAEKEEPKKSIHMKLQDEAEMVSLFEKFNSKPIESISKAITISKRFEFQNNFFDGDAAGYKEFIALIDNAGDREGAFQIYHEYKNRLAWDNEDLKDELKSLLYRKYAP